MSLKEEERVTLVNLYLEKSAETLDDAHLTFLRFGHARPLVA